MVCPVLLDLSKALIIPVVTDGVLKVDNLKIRLYPVKHGKSKFYQVQSQKYKLKPVFKILLLLCQVSPVLAFPHPVKPPQHLCLEKCSGQMELVSLSYTSC